FANHCSKFIADRNARAGILEGNPLHRDMLYAVEAVGLSFILNVTIDTAKNITAAFAGHPVKAHLKGCASIMEKVETRAVKADMVITSNGGYPLDQDIYQAVKGMTAAEACVNEGGVIIMCASCINGHGGEGFFNWFAQAASPHDVAARIAAIPQDKTLADQWEAQILARILTRISVVMVCEPSQKEIIEKMHMTYAPSIEQAIKAADEILNKKGKIPDNEESSREIVIIPDGIGIVVRQ
ncbi:MAG: lactate racemization operon protein LarA, partial [Eubacteriales bacterium]|nr:lactate racemization operon protein LarA [Eubacteriales bacterium]